LSRFRAYIKPFNETGQYTEFQEVTQYIDFTSLGKIKQQVDQDEYNVGVFKFSSFQIKANNASGKFSDTNVVESIFRNKRSNSVLKLTWQIMDDGPYCGLAVCGSVASATLSEEVEIFQGLINDESTAHDLKTQILSFNVLGLESIFSQVEFPYSSISNGDLFSDILFEALNQSAITDLITVDVANINLDTDIIIDDKSDWKNKTVKEVLDDILLGSNSVLWILDSTLYINSREAEADVSRTFYGQASDSGIEDIQSINNLKNGLNKVFNYWTWSASTEIASDIGSIDTFGIRKKEVDVPVITNTTRRGTILTSLKDEFKSQKQEMTLVTTFSYEKLDLFILSRVNVDYPNVYLAVGNNPIPRYDLDIYDDEARYPDGIFSLELTTDQFYKVMGRSIDCKNQLIEFNLREI